MSIKVGFLAILFLFLAGFIVFCGVLVVESGLFEAGRDTNKSLILLSSAMVNERQEEDAGFKIEYVKPDEQLREPDGADWTSGFTATGSLPKTLIVGAKDPCTENPEEGFKYQLELTSRGAAIRKVTFSDGGGKGFNNRDADNPEPLALLESIRYNNTVEISTMANLDFVLVEEKQKLALQNLFWESLGVKDNEDGSESVTFVADIVGGGIPIIRIAKTYSLRRGSYLMNCEISVRNLTDKDEKFRFNLRGAAGIGREGLRADMRKAVGGFVNADGEIVCDYKKALSLKKAETVEDRRIETGSASDLFLWAGIINKYFASIVIPLPDDGKDYCDWISDRSASYYNPDRDPKGDSGDETIGVNLSIKPEMIKAGETRRYRFELYFGPKDKRLFDKEQRLKELGFINLIDFMPCFCCPAAIIRPLAFGILAMMEWLYLFIPNYGVVIIILVFIVRLILHPLTKKGQVSMSKMSKLAPKVEQIKKKYAGDKAELNKQVMALYREQGASPFTGMLPMFVQMPIWIALYSAIYASISLRGAAFLPFWITDLSAPDALFRFPSFELWIFGKVDSFNFLPILMGLAFYLQQKLMPSQSGAASTNPQLAQQQKMMMVMMPILFPLMLYKAPSGLNLYIMSSVSAGVVEQYFIRKHIREKEEAESQGLVSATSKTGGKAKKKKSKPFFKNM